MPTMREVKNRVFSRSIANRNKEAPFEFGNIRSQDRMYASALIRDANQGNLLSSQCSFDTGLLLPNGIAPGIKSAAFAFRSIQRFFESHAIEQRLKPWSVLGFMSDSMVPCGLAGVLSSEDDSVQFINVTAGAFFHTLYSAYHVVSDSRFEPSLPGAGQYIPARAEKLFSIELQIPASEERRRLATKFAITALRVTFFHELAHILRGHLPYLRQNIGGSEGIVISETSDQIKNTTKIIDLNRRALETDADDFSGRFMAKQFFQDFSKEELSLQHSRFRARIFEVLVGVVLMYSWFAECEKYHSGLIRAYVVLSSMFVELGLDKESAKWMHDRISGLQQLMIERQLLPKNVPFVDGDQSQDLIMQTIDYRESHMREWLKFRPWGFND